MPKGVGVLISILVEISGTVLVLYSSTCIVHPSSSGNSNLPSFNKNLKKATLSIGVLNHKQRPGAQEISSYKTEVILLV